MKPVLERCSVIVAGSWNLAIFTPEWIQSVCAGAVVPEMQVVFGPNGLAFQFVSGNIKIVIVPSQFQLVVTSFEDAAFKRMEDAAVEILQRLRETPVRAVGINFGFDVWQGREILDQILEFSDGDALASNGATCSAVSLTRRLSIDEHVINMIITRRGSHPIRLDFNHHFDVVAAAEASSADLASLKVRNAVLAAKERSLLLARDVYGLSVE